MITTKFYLDRRMKAKDGKGNIVILICFNRTSATIPTGVRVLSDDWDGSKVINRSDSMAINIELIKQKAELDKNITILSLEENLEGKSAAYVKSRLAKQKTPRKTDYTVQEIFREYMERTMKKNTYDIYQRTLKKVLSFGGNNIRIEDITLKWLLQFDKYLSMTQSVNGRAIYLRALRAVCVYAESIGVISPNDYPFRKFSIRLEETKKRCVSIDDLRTFYNYPTRKLYSMYRDYFFLMFFLIGINTVDLLTAKKSAIVNGRFEYIREKTGRRFSIKIEPEAQKLLDKYAGSGEYLLEAMDHCKNYKSFAREINEAIQKIGPTVIETIENDDELFSDTFPKQVRRIEPILPGVTTYYSRHTWATLAYEIGIPGDVISQALGHASFGNRTTMVYIKTSQDKVDKANRKVIDYLFDKYPIMKEN